ncbi:VPLPA-CTERM sorting domain-containing protein [Desulfobacula sp.]|uniref:VPLPA-CTERM sorting domain-containing protein n=1 Tax=Desulfobacula sp. TaxID=2593537 RepID=UPI0039B85678
MKKLVILVLLLGSILLFPITAMTASVTFDYTADNIVNAWYVKDGSTVEPQSLGVNAGDWWLKDSFTISLTAGSSYDVIWQASDLNTSPTDVAGFLASISSADPISGNLLSSVSWSVTTDTTWQTAAWVSATSSGKNDGSAHPWGGHIHVQDATGTTYIDGIDQAAEWIWTSDRKSDNNVFIKTTFAVNSVPVPAAFWLFGSGLVGLVGFRRRRKSS